MKCRIKTGARILHDFAVFEWPGCKPPEEEYEGEEYEYRAKDPDMVFDAELKDGGLDCRRQGYGNPHHYGNGALTVLSERDIEVIRNR